MPWGMASAQYQCGEAGSPLDSVTLQRMGRVHTVVNIGRLQVRFIAQMAGMLGTCLALLVPSMVDQRAVCSWTVMRGVQSGLIS